MFTEANKAVISVGGAVGFYLVEYVPSSLSLAMAVSDMRSAKPTGKICDGARLCLVAYDWVAK